MPLLLRGAMILGAFFGIVGTTAGIAGALGLALGDGPYAVNGEAVSKSEFLAIAVPFLLFYVAACITAGTAAWSLWKRRARSRLLLTVLLAEFVVGDAAVLALARRLLGTSSAELALSVSTFVLLVALALWYLFRNPAVVGYYESLPRPPSEVHTTNRP